LIFDTYFQTPAVLTQLPKSSLSKESHIKAVNKMAMGEEGSLPGLARTAGELLWEGLAGEVRMFC
jgi:hypothetical protein